jgi:phenylpropionate dioxygenase-like ring-hydroxylating dioxygenase large terminal subunit
MLSQEENQLLTRIGPGTAMGAVLRQYWMPVLLSTEVAQPDGPPLRVRLVGEDLIAFRATSGEVALVSQACPHRGASLFYGRNEQDGLRCPYHGWKFDVRGRCVEMPNAAPDSDFKNRVGLTAYPCRERHGVIWAYLGPRAEPPPLPDFEWNTRPDNIPFLWRNYRACNWVQCLEGDIDSSHINYLHGTLDPQDLSTVPGRQQPGYTRHQMPLVHQDGAPHLEVVDTEVGVMYGAKRRLDAGRDYWRVHPFLFPFHTMVGGGLHEDEVSFNGKAWVPMDDEQTLVFEWQYRPGEPWTDAERDELMRIRNPWGYLPATNDPAGAWRPQAHAGNDYFLDRSLERTKLACGILSSPLQDTAVQESMGPICNRTREHLVPADAMIIAVRRLLAAARALHERGETPPGVDQPELYRVRPVGVILPPGSDWFEATKARRAV